MRLPRRLWRIFSWTSTAAGRRSSSSSLTAAIWPRDFPRDTSCVMRTSTLLARNLAWFWRTNLAVVLGVSTATAVLAGALLVGDSVRASLRDLVLGRLGNAGYVVTGTSFFREQLAAELGQAVPMIVLDGVAVHEPSGRRAANVQVYGVDERYWRFQGEAGQPPRGREVLLSMALAHELGAKAGASILLRAPKPSAIPLESLHGRKENVGQ